jgi:hypothetical protein
VVWRDGLLKRGHIVFLTMEMDSWTRSEGIENAAKFRIT